MSVLLLSLLFLSPQQESAEEIFRKFEAKYSSPEFMVVDVKASWTVSAGKEVLETTYKGKAAVAEGDRFLVDLDFDGAMFSDHIIFRSDGKTDQTIATMHSKSSDGEDKVTREPQTRKTEKGGGRFLSAFFTRACLGLVLVAVKQKDPDEKPDDPDEMMVVHDFAAPVKGREGERDIVTLSYKVTFYKEMEVAVQLVLDAKTHAPIRRTCTLIDEKGPGDEDETHVFSESYPKVSTGKIQEDLFQHKK